MSINNLKAQIKGGDVARPNRFEVVVEFPAFAGGADLSRKTSFFVNSTQLPSSTLGVTEVPFRGRMLKLPGDREFTDWTGNFIVDNSFDLRDAFERWHNGMNSYNTNIGASDINDVFGVVDVYQLDNNDNRIKEYNLLLAWPSVVGQIELAQDSNNTFEQFEVTFVYSDMNSNGVST